MIKTTIIGGDFGIKKESGIIKKISNEFENSIVYNGGLISDLPLNLNSDLILWFPNISNENEKLYPKKAIGNVLICSKVMRDGYRTIDAISRIFKMNGNAVIAIYKEDLVRFKFVDALGNIWYDGNSIPELSKSIINFYNFTKSAIRINSIKSDYKLDITDSNVDKFIELNIKLANHIQISCGDRFFGNISTRCQKLFPSIKPLAEL